MTPFLSLAALCLSLATASMPPASQHRGLIALPQDSGRVFLSWRLFPDDPDATRFRIYRAAESAGPFTLVVETPWTSHLDAGPEGRGLVLDKPVHYQVRVVLDDAETAVSETFSVTPRQEAVDGIRLSTDIEPEVATVDARRHVDRCVPADLDGDGVLDYVIIFPKNYVDPYYWKPSVETMKLRAINGRSGQVMWTFDMGPGIEQGVWYSPFVAYDLDGDGRAEVVTRTLPRPVFGQAQDGLKIRGGAEYLTVLDGMTGQVRVTAPWPKRTGFSGYNHANRHLLAIAYLDGQRPAILVNRGTYITGKWEAWYFDTTGQGPQLTQLWAWSTLDEGNAKYAGSGGHATLVADIDGDGMDEFFWGCVCFDGDGQAARVKWAVWAPGHEDEHTIGHADHVGFGMVRPDLPGPQVYYVTEHQNAAALYGWNEPDPRKGAVLVEPDGTPHWVYRGARSLEAAGVADIVGGPDAPGWEIHYCESDGSLRRLCRSDGTVIAEDFHMPKTIQWDGGPTLQIISPEGEIYNYGQPPHHKMGDHAWITMCLGDFVGDFREEMVARMPDGSLKILVNTTPIAERRPSPLLERTYRLSLAAYGSGYVGLPARGGQTWMTPIPPSATSDAPTTPADQSSRSMP